MALACNRPPHDSGPVFGFQIFAVSGNNSQTHNVVDGLDDAGSLGIQGVGHAAGRFGERITRDGRREREAVSAYVFLAAWHASPEKKDPSQDFPDGL
jgi:hypothetical protein